MITTTAGQIIFLPWQCEFCQLSTVGEHAYNCPNRPQKKENVFIPDPVEDYNDSTEFY